MPLLLSFVPIFFDTPLALAALIDTSRRRVIRFVCLVIFSLAIFSVPSALIAVSRDRVLSYLKIEAAGFCFWAAITGAHQAYRGQHVSSHHQCRVCR